MAMEPDAGTKMRLLDVAREVFARRGPQAATVREICSLAGANVAAVNYHFGSKEKLFMAVLEDYLRRCFNRYPVDMGLGPEATPSERLRAYIRSLLYRLMGDGDPFEEKLGMLLTAEIVEPSEQFEAVAARYLMPPHNELLRIVAGLLPRASDQTVKLCAAGVTGHCMLFDNAKQLLRRLRPEMALENLGVELVADFVFRYASAGIASMGAA
ncbi:MAG: CerR family C-terminal domain-containing protein [Humidesulfovibrio sp.]|nr:CerR family C-terminal domain-containing protein [Humidesulfovibrio sp.]